MGSVRSGGPASATRRHAAGVTLLGGAKENSEASTSDLLGRGYVRLEANHLGEFSNVTGAPANSIATLGGRDSRAGRSLCRLQRQVGELYLGSAEEWDAGVGYQKMGSPPRSRGKGEEPRFGSFLALGRDCMRDCMRPTWSVLSGGPELALLNFPALWGPDIGPIKPMLP